MKDIELPPLPERDTAKPAEEQGVFRKFDVRRTDGSSEPGGKHHGCEYFVLDVDHDPAAHAALAAYADAIEATHPVLAADMRSRYGLARAAVEADRAQRVPDGWANLLDAAREVLIWTQAADRPPVRDKYECGRMTGVRVHALADLHEAVQVLASTPAPAQHQSLPDAMQTVITAMQADPGYAWSWHCNLAMAMVDSGCDHVKANQGAARFMRTLANVDPAHELPSAPAQQEPSEAEMVCAEAYQVVGCLLSDLGLFETEAARKILDNLSEARRVHQDVLPWESATAHQEPPQQERKPMTGEEVIEGLSEIGVTVWGPRSEDFERGVRFAERHHGIKE